MSDPTVVGLRSGRVTWEVEIPLEDAVSFLRWALPPREYENWLLDVRSEAAWENEGGR